MSSIGVDYKSLEHQRSQELQSQLQAELEKELENKSASAGGEIDSLHRTILGLVVAANYDSAQSEMIRFVKIKSDYPDFAIRVAPYIQHCKELIVAIRTKRDLPGMGSLPMSKQQELYERVTGHFDELHEYLKKIEIIEKEVKLNDLRSTVWVIKAFFHSVFVIFIVGFVMEVVIGLGGSMNIVLDDMITNIVRMTFKIFS